MIIHKIVDLSGISNQFFVQTEDNHNFSFFTTSKEKEMLHNLPTHYEMANKDYALFVESQNMKVGDDAKALIENHDGTFRFKCNVKRLPDTVK